jgi:hypothetical protein
MKESNQIKSNQMKQDKASTWQQSNGNWETNAVSIICKVVDQHIMNNIAFHDEQVLQKCA